MTWMKAAAAARYAGGVNTKLLYRAVRDGRLRCARVGLGRNVIPCDRWLDEWLASSSESTGQEIVAQQSGLRRTF